MSALIPPTPGRSERRIKDLVSHLEFRKDLGACYLIVRARSRAQLYVPTMHNRDRFEPVGKGAFNLSTVYAAQDRGLIQIGDWLPVMEVSAELAVAVRLFEGRLSSVMQVSLPGGGE